MKKASAISLAASIIFAQIQPWTSAASRSTNGGSDGATRSGMHATQALGGFSYPLEPQVEEVSPIDDLSVLPDAMEQSNVSVDRASLADVLPARFMGEDVIHVPGSVRLDERLSERFERSFVEPSRIRSLGTGEIFGERARNLDVGALPGEQASPETFKPKDAVPESAKIFMKQDLDLLHAFLHANYAPESKKAGQPQGWDLSKIIEDAKRKVDETPGLSLKEYWKIHKGVIDSARDYHMASIYLSSEVSVLPFTVMGAISKKDGLVHYHISFIDREKLPKDSFPFEVGDELVSFGGKATRDAVKEIQDEMVANKAATDQALASLFLTLRRGARGMDVPTEPIDIVVRRKGGLATETRQVAWDYSPETIEYNLSQFHGLSTQSFGVHAQEFLQTLLIDAQDMLSPVVEAFQDQLSGKNYLEGNPHGLGNKESFLPKLGEIEQDLSTDNFHAYIYKNKEGKKIGYVRIANYTPQDADAALEDFAGIVAKLEAGTDGLFIDQFNNPGGSVFYLYALASMLTPQALTTPKHQMAINPQQVLSAQKLLQAASMIKNDEQAKAMLGPSFGGFPVSFQLVKFLQKYAMDVISEWKQGHALTKPIHMYGVDKINPSIRVHYSKPIVIGVNELDFSGGDFFTYIMSTNGRAKLFGHETAGAGGFVLELKYPNLLGIDSIHYTGSTTDVENNSGPISYRYQITTDDLENNFQPMADAINTAMSEETLLAKIDAFARAHLHEIVEVPGIVGVGPAKFFEDSGPTLVIMLSGKVPEDQVRADLLSRLPELASLPYRLWTTGEIVAGGASSATTSAEFEQASADPAMSRRLTTSGVPIGLAAIPALGEQTKSAIQAVFDDLKSKAFAGVEWHAGVLLGRYVSLDLGRDEAGNEYQAMIRVGQLAPQAPVQDPNLVGHFFIRKKETSTGQYVHSVHSVAWPVSAPFFVPDFALQTPLSLGHVAWEDETGPVPGAQGAIRFTFYDIVHNMLQLQLPKPGLGEVGGDPVFKFSPPDVTEADESKIKDYPITQANAAAAQAFLDYLVSMTADRAELDKPETQRVLAEAKRRIELIRTTAPVPTSIQVEGGSILAFLSITPERAKEVWPKVRAQMLVPPEQPRRYRRLERPSPDRFAELNETPRFTFRPAEGQLGSPMEVYVTSERSAIARYLSSNPDEDQFFEVPLD